MTKQFAQFKYPGSPINMPEAGEYSENLLEEQMIVVGIAIYAPPGTRFQINQLNSRERNLTINGLGVFQMDTQERPITGLFLNKDDYETNNQYQPIIIDLVYQKGEI